MAISEEMRKQLHERAGGRCECEMTVCGHQGRCSSGLSAGYWDAHHRDASGSDNLGNLLTMCATCHKNTRTYGK